MTAPQINGGTITRLCGGATIREDGFPSAAAYKLTDSDKKHNPPYLSFNWLEHFGGLTRQLQIDKVKTALNGKRHVGPKARLTLLDIRTIEDTFQNRAPNITVDIRHYKEVTDPSHCGLLVLDVARDESVIASTLAETPCDHPIPAKV